MLLVLVCPLLLLDALMPILVLLPLPLLGLLPVPVLLSWGDVAAAPPGLIPLVPARRSVLGLLRHSLLLLSLLLLLLVLFLLLGLLLFLLVLF